MSADVATQSKAAGTADVPRVEAAALAAFVKRAFEAAGLPSADADILAGLVVEADLRGSDTHGVIRLPLYLRGSKPAASTPARIFASCRRSRPPRSSTATTAWAIW
jgi:LDH2 family malate/lactate/ureidoglycolate dehydrogenase